MGRIVTLPWFKTPGRLRQEQGILSKIPFFAKSEESTQGNQYVVSGDLSFERRYASKPEIFRIRIEYPFNFPKAEQLVFDANRRFSPGTKGHMFIDHGLCLSLPEREEFSINTDDLTSEVLGASLVWFHKRLIYERLKRWPGEEYHGIEPRLEILLARAGLWGLTGIEKWMSDMVKNHREGPAIIDPYSRCPCNGLQALKFCHWEVLRRFFRVVSTIERHTGYKHS